MSEFSDIVAVINARARHYAPSPWTDERIARLKALVASGATRGEMARTLGLSRNAICGACHRMGLSAPRIKLEPGTAHALWRAKRNAQARARTARRKELGLPPPPRKPEARAMAEEPPADKPAGGAVDIAGLTATTCRWPLWRQDAPFAAKMYCGEATVPEASYCPIHLKMSLQPTRWRP